MIHGQNVFDQPVKNNLRRYDSIWKIAIGQGDDYPTGCLLDSDYFKKYFKIIPTDLSKQQALDADPKAIQQVNFTGNLENNAVIRSKRNYFRFFARNRKSILILYFAFI